MNGKDIIDNKNNTINNSNSNNNNNNNNNNIASNKDTILFNHSETTAVHQQQLSSSNVSKQRVKLDYIMPKSGLVYSERGPLSAVLCKPKIMGIKSMTLQKMEDMEQQALRTLKQQSV